MFPSIAFFATASLYFFALADTAPSKRQSDNGACAQLAATCATTCFGVQCPVDDFLASLFTTKNGANAGTPLQSVNLPRVSSSIRLIPFTSSLIYNNDNQLLNALSDNGKAVTQQHFIDGVYGQLSVSNGPYPSSADIVIGWYNCVSTWTAFCTGNIPFQNFQDYYQYSSSVLSNGCAATSTVTPPTTTSPTTSPVQTTIVVSPDATCQKMFTSCVDQVNSAVDNTFSIRSCVLGATCFGGQRPVGGFIATVYGQKNGNSGNFPEPANQARVSTALFNAGSTDGGKTWTQQNFIDAWYAQLSAVGGPFPPNPDMVISYFNRIAE